MTAHTYRRFDAKADTDDVARILSIAFGGDDADSRRWIGNTGHVSRVHVEGGRICGVLSLYPMGQWFGRRAVPMWGVAGVAIDPRDRGRGVGTRIMQDAVVEMHRAGVALSTLYPAVQSVYRRAGYERAGHQYLVEAVLGSIAPVDRGLPLRLATPDDEPALERLERERARPNDGNVDRDAIMWKRAREPQGKPTEAHVVEEHGQITGYVRMRHVNRPQARRLWCSEVVAATPAAARRLLALLADHASQIDRARWLGHPTGPLQSIADALCFEVKVADVWMLRIPHVESALTARGYPPGLTAEAHLEIEDDLCPGNAGRWLLRVADGAGTVERGGEGRVRLHVRDLAPVYTGHASPLVLRAARRIDGPESDLLQLGAIFAGGAPWMQDAF